MTSSSSCQQCARMLKHVLAQESSRPMTILEAIGGKQGKDDEAGVEMRIPLSKTVPTRRWSQLRHPTDQALLSTATMATSALRAHTPAETLEFESLKVECRPCSEIGPEGGARAFVMGPSPLSIVLCSNRLSYHDSSEIEQVLVHELVHIYDLRVNRLDLRSCENLAYSEVRAARDAECKDAWLAGRYCIPNKAFMATSNLFPPDEARECLARVYDDAMADRSPLLKKKKPIPPMDDTQETHQPRSKPLHEESFSPVSER